MFALRNQVKNRVSFFGQVINRVSFFGQVINRVGKIADFGHK